MTHHSCNPPSCYLLLPSETRYAGNCKISLTAHKVKYQTNRRFIPGKRARYGIKCWVMADTRNCFVSWFCVYTGRDANVVADVPQSTGGLLQLVEGYENIHHHLYVDNFYTSPALFTWLMEHGIIHEPQFGRVVLASRGSCTLNVGVTSVVLPTITI